MLSLACIVASAALVPRPQVPPHVPALLAAPSLTANPLAAIAADDETLLSDAAHVVYSILPHSPLGIAYTTFCVGLWATISLRGGTNVMMRNGTVYRDGKPVPVAAPATPF